MSQSIYSKNSKTLSNTNQKYFFVIDPYVYYQKKDKRIFVYNTLTQKYLSSDDPDVWNFLKDIQGSRYLSVKTLYSNQLKKKPNLKKFLLKMRDSFFGDLVELKKGEEPPIQLYPILKLKKTKSGKFEFDGESNTLDYLKHVSI